RAKGFYLQRGLDVDILRGGPNHPAAQALASGQADFGTLMLASALQEHERGVRLVNIAQIVQRSAYMLVAKRSSGILTPGDLQGRKVGLWGSDFQAQAKAFFVKNNLSVTVVPQAATMNLFLRDGVAAASTMWYNGYHFILNAGYNPDELTTFFFFENGLNFPEDGIYCSEKTYQSDPKRCRAFVDASIEGWRYAFEHPGEALDIVMNYAEQGNCATNSIHQQWMLARMQDICLTNGIDSPTGTLVAADYNRVVQMLNDYGVIEQAPSFEHFYKGRENNE
ncbi:MAG: ABC transporter substrate-binding protein, partial [Deltaproteobacteria bacterium]|nr:ABC transporter substrate-binding protein [Deltaproteobacteria bacterium]